MSSAVKVSKKVPAPALSRHEPGLPMEQVMPACRSRAWVIQSRKVPMLVPSFRAPWVTGTFVDRVSRTAWWRNSGKTVRRTAG